MSRTIRRRKENKTGNYYGSYLSKVFPNGYRVVNDKELQEIIEQNNQKGLETKYCEYYQYFFKCRRYFNYAVEGDKREKYHNWKYMHGESSNANARSPGHSYRRYRETELRSHNKQELIKYRQREDYEPMVMANPLSCWWDWS